MNAIAQTLESLLGRKRDRQLEQTAKGWQAYREILEALAGGEEVDLDELEIVLDQLGKTESDLAGDVEKFQKRKQAADDLKRNKKAHSELAKARAKHERACEERRQALLPLDAAVAETREELLSLERLCDQTAGAEQRLRQSVLDPAVLQRRAELNGKLQELSSELTELQERYDNQASFKARIDSHERSWSQKCDDAKRYGQPFDYEQSQRNKLREQQMTIQVVMDRIAGPMQELKTRQSAIRAELDQLASEELQP